MKFFKKAISVVLSCAIVIGSCLAGQPTLVKAVDTTTSDGTVKGSGSAEAAKGNWNTSYDNPTVYRVYPIKQGDIWNESNSKEPVTLGYEKYYYNYRDLALYISSSTKSDNAYYFKSGTDRGANPIKDMTLSHSLSTEALGVSLNLPQHKFEPNVSEYISFSDELNKKIITEGKDQNITSIFTTYLYQVEKRKDKLSSKGKTAFEALLAELGVDENDIKSNVGTQQVGTGVFNKESIIPYSNLRNFGLVIEVCSLANNKLDGKQYVLSYGDLLVTGIENDAYYVYKVFKEAADKGKLLTWSAKDNKTNVKVQPSKALGEAAYFFVNIPTNDMIAQSINIVVGTKDEISAKESIGEIYHTYRFTSTKVNPSVNLGASMYLYNISYPDKADLPRTKVTLRGGKESIDTLYTNKTLSTLSGLDDYDEDTICMGYDILKVPFSSNEYLPDDFHRMIDIEKYLKNIKTRTVTHAVEDGFGNIYGIEFLNNDVPIKSKIKKSVQSSGVFDEFTDTISSFNRQNFLTMEELADIQASTLFASCAEGKYDSSAKGFKSAEGTYYVNIAYLAQDKRVSSKEAEVYVNANGGIEVLKDTRSKGYSVADTVKWDVMRKEKSSTYAIAWNAGSYKLENASELAKQIINYAGAARSTSELTNAFTQVTGVTPVGVKSINEDTIEVGCTSNETKELHGINVLVLNISTERPIVTGGTDLVESDELNYVYPNLLGAQSLGYISPIGNGISNIIYPYSVTDNNSGDLINFKGSLAHYYYKPTGLFDTYSQGTKSFNSTAYPSYAYNLSRGLWGDAVVASNYRGLSATDESVKNDLKNVLGLNIGAVGKDSPVALGNNVDGRVSQAKKDNYSFLATISHYYYTYVATKYGIATIRNTETVNQRNNYAVTHALNKYTCMALDTATNAKNGKAGFNIQSNTGIKNKVTMVTQSDKKLTVYPEVAYKYYKAETSNGVLNNVTPLTVYVMGEKARTMKPSAIRGIAMDYINNSSDVANGKITSDGVLTGSEAAGSGNGKQVIAQGTDITMKANHTVSYKLISYALDVSEKVNGVEVRKAFSSENISYDPREEHEAYVNDFVDNVEVDTYMNIGKKEYEMATSNSKSKVSLDTTNRTIDIEFSKGYITDESKKKVIYDMAHEYNISESQAEEMFKSSGFEKQLQKMFESCNENANASNNKWYDEESITICIQKYVTCVHLVSCIVQDKIDYNVFGANGVSASGQTNHTTKDAYFTMSVSVPEDFENCNLKDANVLFDRQKIKDTDFKVSSASTHDFGD